MIQCKYCGEITDWPINMKHKENCIDIPPRTYIPELFQEVQVGGSAAGGIGAGGWGGDYHFSFFKDGIIYGGVNRRSGKDRRR